MDISAVYQATEPYLYRIVGKHRQQYGGDREELLSQAHYHFVLACHSWRPGGYWKTLHGWIGYYVSRELRESVRTHARRSRLLSRKYMHLEGIPMRQSFDLHAMLKEVSDDARCILELVVGPHLNNLIDNKNSKEPLPWTKRCYLKRFLREAGWTVRRISESFQEIAEVLG